MREKIAKKKREKIAKKKKDSIMYVDHGHKNVRLLMVINTTSESSLT